MLGRISRVALVRTYHEFAAWPQLPATRRRLPRRPSKLRRDCDPGPLCSLQQDAYFGLNSWGFLRMGPKHRALYAVSRESLQQPLLRSVHNECDIPQFDRREPDRCWRSRIPRLEHRRSRSAKRLCRAMPEPGLGGASAGDTAKRVKASRGAVRAFMDSPAEAAAVAASIAT